MTEKTSIGEGEAVPPVQERLMDKLKQRLARREQRCRQAVQSLYRHQALSLEGTEQRLLDADP